jgi:hypothetical protein
MRTTLPLFLTTRRLLALCSAALLLCQTLPAAVTFTVTPSAISNTYSGPITLQVGGLNNGETVVVQQFLDANTNGIIDAGDWLVQQFRLTDGVASVIGGVTNINVPGDATPTNGAITAVMNFVTSGSALPLSGQSLYKLSSPTGRFTPVTNLFTVTNVPCAQWFTGNVLCSGTNVANALILAFSGPAMDSSPVAGTVANNAGAYMLKLPAGSYSLVAFKSNFVANAATAPFLTLGSGATPTANLTMLPATTSISGKVVDAANSNLGLAGLILAPGSSDNLRCLAFTDTNGTFSARVTSSQWRISFNESQLPASGYLKPQDNLGVDTTTGGVAGVTIALPKATALVYGSVKDEQSRPLAGVRLTAQGANNQYQGQGITDQNGNYVAAVSAGEWYLTPDSSSPGLANCIFPQPDLTLAAGQALQADFPGLLATNQISGYLRDGQNNGIGGVAIWVDATINGVDYQSGVDTDESGYFVINVANNSWWAVGVNYGQGGDSLSNSYLCPNSQSVYISGNNGVANFIAQSASIQLSGYVKDSSNNQPVANVQVFAYATINSATYNESTQTDGNGYYTFNVASGSWNVGLSCGSGGGSLNQLGFLCATDQSTNISSANAVVNFTLQARPPLQITTTSLANGTQNLFYSQQLQATGGQSPYFWSWSSNPDPLPSGLSLSSDGILSGYPTATGTFSFSIQANDPYSPMDYASQSFSLIIATNLSPLLTGPARLANGQFQFSFYAAAGQSYTIQYSTTLTDWTNLVTLQGSGGPMSFSPSTLVGTDSRRFYRVKAGQ